MAKARSNLATLLRNSEDSLAAGDIETIIALDAAEAGNKDAHKLLRGAKATISIGSDSYPAKIVSATPSLSTIVAEYTSAGLKGDRMTFRKTKDGYRFKKHYRLRIGSAESRWDPQF